MACIEYVVIRGELQQEDEAQATTRQCQYARTAVWASEHQRECDAASIAGHQGLKL